MSEKETPLTEAFYYILLALRKPNHGYGVIQEIEELTGGRVVLGPGTLTAHCRLCRSGNGSEFTARTQSRGRRRNILSRIWAGRPSKRRRAVWKNC